jgi:hypothetical protein
MCKNPKGKRQTTMEVVIKCTIFKKIIVNSHFPLVVATPILGWYHKECHTMNFLDPLNFLKSQ